MRTTAVLVLLMLVAPATAAQAGDSKLAPKPSWMPESATAPPEVDKKTAKTMAKTFKSAIKVADVDAQLAAIEALAAGRHESFAKVLSPLLTRGEHPVRRRAAEAMGLMRTKKAIPHLEKAMRSQKNRGEADIMDALGSSIGLCADPKKSVFKSHGRNFESGSKELKRAIVLMFGHARDRASLPLLAKWLEAPKPENPDSASNPPASYWKARYMEWNFIKKRVKWAIWNITGELLEDEDSVKSWIKREKQSSRRR